MYSPIEAIARALLISLEFLFLSYRLQLHCAFYVCRMVSSKNFLTLGDSLDIE